MDKVVKEWIRRAHSSLALSKSLKTEIICYEDLSFSCQQSAEKALKGLIIYLGLKPPKTHSFEILLDIIKKRMVIPEKLYDVLDLSDYAVITRYPDDYAPIDKEEYNKSVEIAEYVYNWVVKNTK